VSEALEPTELRAPRGARVMEIDWADGHRSVYPHDLLRGFCPCAQCQGHNGPIRYVEGGDLELTDIQPVGNYALRRHSTRGELRAPAHLARRTPNRDLQPSVPTEPVRMFILRRGCTKVAFVLA
jgi:hypothetical protein